MTPSAPVRLGDIAREVSERSAANHGPPVYSVTKHAGFVPRLEFFTKQVFSRDTSGYKLVRRDQFAYATIHLDEGSVGLLTDVDAALISPMYTVFEVDTEKVYPPYLFRVLKAPQMLSVYSRLGKGSVHRRKAISFERLAAVPIALPTLSEQRHVAYVLDKADAIHHRQKEAIALTEQLLRSAFLEMFGDLMTNPKRWSIRPLGTLLTTPLRNGLSPASGGAHTANVLTLSAITRGRFDETAIKPGTFAVEPWDDVRLDDRDFLICRGNGNMAMVGSGAFPISSDPTVVFPDTMIAARVDEARVCRAFLTTVWKSPFVRRQIEAGARTTNGTFKVNQSLVESVSIPVPERPKQHAFEVIALQLSKLSAKFAGSSAHTGVLLEAMVDRALRGKLIGTRAGQPQLGHFDWSGR